MSLLSSDVVVAEMIQSVLVASDPRLNPGPSWTFVFVFVLLCCYRFIMALSAMMMKVSLEII